jgi:hypothetical protein
VRRHPALKFESAHVRLDRVLQWSGRFLHPLSMTARALEACRDARERYRAVAASGSRSSLNCCAFAP